MNLFSGSDDQIMMQLEQMIIQLKKDKHPTYHGLYCYLQCLKANDIIMMDIDQDTPQETYKEELEKSGWMLREFFAQTPLKVVYERQQTLPDEFHDIDLVEMFSKMKSELHLDLVTLIEDQLLEERDTELRIHFPYLFQDGRNIDNIDSYDEQTKNTYKITAYKNIVLRDYFSKTSGITALENFIEDAYDEGSLFFALEKTRNITLKKTVKTRRDRFHFYQLIERYISFSDSYDNEQEDMLRSIFEFGTKMLKMDIIESEYAHQKEQLTEILLLGIITHYQSTYVTSGHAQIMEYVLCCLTPCLVTQKTIMLDEVVTHTGRTPNKDIKKLLNGLWKIVMEDTIYIKDGFYHTYPNRFTLEEFRIRNKAMDLLAENDIFDAKKVLKELTRHTLFFRYKFNNYTIQFWESLFTSINFTEKKNNSSAIKSLQQTKLILHDRRAFIINEYPPLEIKKKLKQIDDHDLYVEKVFCKINGVHFDEQAYNTKKYESRQKVGRNDLCPCGSNKKYKKCCAMKN